MQGDGLGPFTENPCIWLSRQSSPKASPACARSAVDSSEFNKRFLVDGQRKGITIVGPDYPVDHGEWLTLIDSRRLGRRRHYEAIADRRSARVGDVLRLGRDDYWSLGSSAAKSIPAAIPCCS